MNSGENCFASTKPRLCSVFDVAASIRTKITNAAAAASSKDDQVSHREYVPSEFGSAARPDFPKSERCPGGDQDFLNKDASPSATGFSY